MARAFRYVVDHGEVFRMTETRYRRYLLAGTREDAFPNAEDFGVSLGSALTVNSLTPSDFSDLYNKEHAALLGQVLAAECPTCGAEPGKQCLSLDKRWQAAKCRTLGILDNGWRKTPHPERVQLAKTQVK
jgi:hypothetical protein